MPADAPADLVALDALEHVHGPRAAGVDQRPGADDTLATLGVGDLGLPGIAHAARPLESGAHVDVRALVAGRHRIHEGEARVVDAAVRIHEGVAEVGLETRTVFEVREGDALGARERDAPAQVVVEEKARADHPGGLREVADPDGPQR